METVFNRDTQIEDTAISQSDQEDFREFQAFCQKELPDIVRVFSGSKVKSLEVEWEGVVVNLEQRKKVPRKIKAPVKTTEKSKEPAEDFGDITPVTSQYLGILHLNDEKNSPLVSVGDNVEKGQTLARIENMNIKNNIKSPRNGKIIDILEEGGRPVEFGQVLFVLDVSGNN